MSVFSLSANITFLVVGYLLGSVLFGPILFRLFGKGDLRQMGSGNIGATNVLRSGNKMLALLTLLGDGLKAILVVGFATMISDDPAVGFAAGIGVVLGHNFSIYHYGKGGKGVAAALGVHLIWWPEYGLVALLIWLLIAAITKWSSLASLTAVVLAPVWGWTLFQWLPTSNFLLDFWIIASCVIAVLIGFAHKQNIIRLLKGQETKIRLFNKSQ